MPESWLNALETLVLGNSIIVIRFKGDELEHLNQSRRGISEFTFARPHYLFEEIRVPTICLIISDDQIFLGLVTSLSAVTTFESRIKVTRAVKILPRTVNELIDLFTEKIHKTNFQSKLEAESEVIKLSPKLSTHMLQKIASISENQGALRAVASKLNMPKNFTDARSLQADAISLALKAFNFSVDDQAVRLELVKGEDTTLSGVNILEDAVIEHDARTMPGFTLVRSDVTGRAVFEKGRERLEVYTANKRPLEKLLGIDLIYINLTKHNVVMLQYKMLELSGKEKDWIYRPDPQFDKELSRMQLFSKSHPPEKYEYRLNNQVFYLKFVKRNSAFTSHSFIIPIEHYQILKQSPNCRGPKGAFRVSFDTLDGRYLRQESFFELLRSGYIGSHITTSKHLRALIEGVLIDNRGIVAAVHQESDSYDNPTLIQLMD